VADIALYPDSNYDQIFSDDSYIFNISIINTGINTPKDSPVDLGGELRYTGNISTSFSITWRVKGEYRFGKKVTGYSAQLDQLVYMEEFPTPKLNGTKVVQFNHTFSRDGFDLGVKPYETIEVILVVSVSPIIYNNSIGTDKKILGDTLYSSDISLYLVYDEKIDYVEGKFQEAEEEIKPLETLPIETRLEETYLKIIDEMRAALYLGDYISALDRYEEYAREREDLIYTMTKELNTSIVQAENLKKIKSDLENRIISLEARNEILEERFDALSEAYQEKLLQLKSTDELSRTTITGALISVIAFFILGRGSVEWRRKEPVKSSQV
jgi:hypothetical protein